MSQLTTENVVLHEPNLVKLTDKVRFRTESSSEELLGSLTTYNGVQCGESTGQTVRTSARVFKKMRQDSGQQQAVSSSTPSTDASEKDKKESRNDAFEASEKEGTEAATSTAKQAKRMPKALWSANEKNLFFEALNEYGKDFDSITAYICIKVKKKGASGFIAKNKHQVSYFYYRTWQKVSKYVKFGDDVKKVAQELYGLINYGEMRKRLASSVVSRIISRLSELVYNGVIAVRTGGRNIRVRTPVCRALRRLNCIEEWEENLKLPSRIAMILCPRDMESWARVHASAHNPRVILPVAPSRRLAPILILLQRRWLNPTDSIRESLLINNDCKAVDSFNSLEQQVTSVLNPNSQTNFNINKIILPLTITNTNLNDSNKNNKNVDSINLESSPENKKDNSVSSKTEDIVGTEENIQKINRTSVASLVLEKDGIELCEPSKNLFNNDDDMKIDNIPNVDVNKSNNKDSEVDINLNKRRVTDYSKNLALYVGPKPGMDFNIPTVNVSEHLTSQRICFSVYQKKLGNMMHTNSSGGTSNIHPKIGSRFKNHKRQRKDSGENDLNSSKKSKHEIENSDKNENFNVFDVDETANDGMNGNFPEQRSSSVPREGLNDDRSNDENNFIEYREKDLFSEQEDEEKYNETDGEGDVMTKALKEDCEEAKKKSTHLASMKNKMKSKKDKEQTVCRDVGVADNIEDINVKSTNTLSSFFKKNWSRDLLAQQVKKGWSSIDASDLTVGDLYLMFGYESKLDLNYWWAKATLPLGDDVIQQIKKSFELGINQSDHKGESISSSSVISEDTDDKGKACDIEKNMFSPKNKNTDTTESDESKKDCDVLSDSKHISTQEQNRQDDELNTTTLNIVSKIINNPTDSNNFKSNTSSIDKVSNQPFYVEQREEVVTITTKLKKLLSLSQLYLMKGRTSCICGHMCNNTRGKKSHDKIQTTNSNDKSHMTNSNDNHAFTVPVEIKIVGKQGNKSKINPLTSSIKLPIQPFNAQRIISQSSSDDYVRNKNNSHDMSDITTVAGNSQKKPEQQNEKDIFRPPYSKKQVVTRNPYSQTMTGEVIDFSTLPKWTNRKGRQPRQPTVVRQLPLVPWPPSPVEKNTPLATIKPIIKITTGSSRPLKTRTSNIKSTSTKEEINMEKVVNEDKNKKPLLDKIPDKPSFKDNINQLLPSSSNTKSDMSLFGSTSKVNIDMNVTDETPSLSNILDVSLPSNLGDENSLGVLSTKLDKNDLTEKHDNFAGFLQAEILSTPSLSPSRLLKDGDDNWLSHDFSLSSFLGHLECIPGLKSDQDTSKNEKNDTLDANPAISISSHNVDEAVDNQFHCLMGDTSIDYVAKFADLAAQVEAGSPK